jgi:D-alanyl-D-alanine carboxypeptidase (penicillin-binding protein 5/6)
MMRNRTAALMLAATMLTALPGRAAAPPFETPATIAFVKDLSSGATLYAKDADVKMPPASMAKMMTVYVAFDLVKQGKLKLSDMATVAPRDVAQMAWPGGGIDDVPVGGRAGLDRQPLVRHRHAFGQ